MISLQEWLQQEIDREWMTELTSRSNRREKKVHVTLSTTVDTDLFREAEVVATTYLMALNALLSLVSDHVETSPDVQIEGAIEPTYCPRCSTYWPCPPIQRVEHALRAARNNK